MGAVNVWLLLYTPFQVYIIKLTYRAYIEPWLSFLPVTYICVHMKILLLLVQRERKIKKNKKKIKKKKKKGNISKWIGPLRDLYFFFFFFFRIIYFVLTYMFASSLLLSSDNMCHKAIWMGHPMRLELTHIGLLVECFYRFCIGISM